MIALRRIFSSHDRRCRKKAVFFVLDGILALVIVMVCTVLILKNMSSPLPRTTSLSMYSDDIVLALDHSHTLHASLTSNASLVAFVRNITAVMPNLCVNVTIFNMTNASITTASSLCTSDGDVAKSYGSFVVNDVFYGVRSEVWLR